MACDTGQIKPEEPQESSTPEGGTEQATVESPFEVSAGFRAMIPPLSEPERARLEESILREGVRSPLVVGRFKFGNQAPHRILLDGHHRYEIAQKHGIPYNIVELEMTTYLDAANWMVVNQLSKRNLSNWQRIKVVAPLRSDYEYRARQRQRRAAQATNKRLGRSAETLTQNSDAAFEQGTVVEQLARLAGVSADTFSRAEFILENGSRAVRDGLDRGELSINQAWQATRQRVRNRERKEQSNERLEAARQGRRFEEFYFGNCMDFIPSLPEGSIRLLLSDPSYGEDYHPPDAYFREHREGLANDHTPDEAIITFGRMLDAVRSKMMPDSHILVFTGAKYEPRFRAELELRGFEYRASVIWDKKSPGMGGPYNFAHQHERIIYYRLGDARLLRPLADVLSYPRVRRGDVSEHPTQKNVDLLKVLVEATSTEREVVADFMAGSGSTLVAAAELGRSYFGAELEERWYKEARRRLQEVEDARRQLEAGEPDFDDFHMDLDGAETVQA